MKMSSLPSSQRLRRGRSFQPRLEALEARTALSTLTVVSGADSGPGSLRDAVASAASGDTIVFDASLRGATIGLTSGELNVTKNLTILGLGAGRLTIDGGASSRLFEVGPGVSLSLSGLTLADGQADVGGGVFNAGSLTLDHVTL